MSSSRNVFICLCFVTMISLTACTPSEPALPSEAIKNIKARLGYVLAPTYLPKGFEFIPLSDSSLNIIETTPLSSSKYVYEKRISKDDTVEIFMSYPSYEGKYSSFEERSGLEAPIDAISEIDINGITAYLFHGRWSDETLKRVARAELPINPEWYYEGGISIRFAIDLSDNEKVWVTVATVSPTDKVTNKDLIKIAKSVVVIE